MIRYFKIIGAINYKSAYKRNLLTIIWWSTIGLLTTYTIILNSSSVMIWGYFIGIGTCFAMSLNKIGATNDNLVDFFTSYRKYIDMDKYNEYLEQTKENNQKVL
jgi:hypothetical protein